MDAIFNTLVCTYCCLNDEHLTLNLSHTSLASIVGYSTNEIEEQFHNHFLELVIPEDRLLVCHKFAEQFKREDILELTFGLRHKDGHTVWAYTRSQSIITDNGEKHLYGALMDISASKEEQDLTKTYLEKYKIILAQTENVIFELDVLEDVMTFSDSWKDIFGYEPHTRDFIKNISSTFHLHPDDLSNLLEHFQVMKNGGAYQSMEVRIETIRGEYLWSRVRATALYDENGDITKIVGIIINIDAEKKETTALQERAEQDALTKLLNNNTARQQAEDYLNTYPPGAHCAMMIIDLDNFKSINDRYGHMYGDDILVRTAVEIKKLFRSGDIVARIGGDEFMVLMKNVSDQELVKDRCSRLIQALRTIFNEADDKCDTSCSIGIAFSPIHGITYYDLFQHADQAMYHAKDIGKSCYAIYEESECRKITD